MADTQRYENGQKANQGHPEMLHYRYSPINRDYEECEVNYTGQHLHLPNAAEPESGLIRVIRGYAFVSPADALSKLL
jgi:hypothetical protein